VIKSKHILVLIVLNFCFSGAYTMSSRKTILHERRQANAIDAMVLTFIAQAMDEYALTSVNCSWERLSLAKSILIGTNSWLAGELGETIYKKVYKKITGRNLRDAMGQSKILGITIDNQRLLRRIISLTILCFELYFLSNHPDLISSN
jgi:hypothetical protein